MTLYILLLVLLLLFVLFTVMTPSLLLSAIGLALTSVMLTIIMFKLGAPLAAVMELSVCAGLITVIFVSTISLAKPLTRTEAKAYVKRRWLRFAPLIIIIALAAIIMFAKPFGFDVFAIAPAADIDVRDVMWSQRPIDLVGQIAMILTGALGIVVLFRNALGRKEDK